MSTPVPGDVHGVAGRISRRTFCAGGLVALATAATACGKRSEQQGFRAVKIGAQTWMAENLSVSSYRNGDAIPEIADDVEWKYATAGARCAIPRAALPAGYEALDPSHLGFLYNYYAITDPRNLAPPGWRVPTDADWETLTKHLGGSEVAGGRLKEAGTTHWLDDNVTHPTALEPFGMRGNGFRSCATGRFENQLACSCVWSSTAERHAEPSATFSFRGFHRHFMCGNSECRSIPDFLTSGFGVRCIADDQHHA